MKKALRTLLLAISLGIGGYAVVPAFAQTPGPSEALAALLQVPGLTIASAGEVIAADTGVRATGVMLESPRYRLLVNSMILSSDPESMTLDLEGVSLRARADAGYNADIRAISLSLSGWPDRAVWADSLCRYLEIIETAAFTGAVIRTPTPPEATSGAAVRRIAFDLARLDQSPDREPCSIEGAVSATGLHAVTLDRQLYSAESVSLDLSLPASIDSARTQIRPGHLRIGVDSFSYASPGEIPAVGILRLDVTLSAPARQWAGLVHLSRMTAVGTASQVPAVRWMQAWNAVHMLAPEVTLDAPAVRLFLPGVLPAAMVANFSRAGLSTIIGSLEYDSANVGDQQAGRLKASVNGVFDIDLRSVFETRPYPMETMRISQQTGDFTFHQTTIAGVESLDLGYTDRGLDGISQAIFSVPAGRYAEEVGNLMIADAPPERLRSLSGVVATISYFFRMATLHPSIRMSLSPSSGAFLFPTEFDPDTVSGESLRTRLRFIATPPQTE